MPAGMPGWAAKLSTEFCKGQGSLSAGQGLIIVTRINELISAAWAGLGAPAAAGLCVGAAPAPRPSCAPGGSHGPSPKRDPGRIFRLLRTKPGSAVPRLSPGAGCVQEAPAEPRGHTRCPQPPGPRGQGEGHFTVLVPMRAPASRLWLEGQHSRA